MLTKSPTPTPGQFAELWVRTDVPWDELTQLHCVGRIGENYKMQAFGGESVEVSIKHLFRNPFSVAALTERDPQAQAAYLVRDAAQSILRARKAPTEPADLLAAIQKHPYLAKLGLNKIESLLRTTVAVGSIEAKRDKKGTIRLESSKNNQIRERMRVFAGSFGDELTALSARVASIINHAPSVGTYREVLLQELLRNHLPTRYHVSTGFIVGCNRQLDVIIYDQQDFAPVFRQGDMVVVPLEAVRAVIEVKTTLTKNNLLEALELLDDVPDTHMNASAPPMFKGVFAFQSNLTEKKMSDVVGSYYNAPHDLENMKFTQIIVPFSHLTSLCVHESAYLQTLYRSEGDKIRPAIISIRSLTDLKPQTSLFWAQLLGYLSRVPVEQNSFNVENVLGADLHLGVESWIAPEVWGPYVSEYLDEDEAESQLKTVQDLVKRVRNWQAGEPW